MYLFYRQKYTITQHSKLFVCHFLYISILVGVRSILKYIIVTVLTDDVEEEVHPEDVDTDVVGIRPQPCRMKIGQGDIVDLQTTIIDNG